MADLKASMSLHHEARLAVPTTQSTPPTSNMLDPAVQLRTTPTYDTAPTIPTLLSNNSSPVNHLNGAERSSATPTNTETIPIPKGSIFSV